MSTREIAEGPILAALDQVPVVGAIGELPVHLVDGLVPQSRRSSVARIAYVAQQSMPRFKTGYDGTVTNDDQRLYVLARGRRGIGFVLTTLEDCFWRVRYEPDGLLHLLSNEAVYRRQAKVGRVWIATNEQRSGLGAALLSLALSHLRAKKGLHK